MNNEFEGTELSIEELETVAGGAGYTEACLAGAGIGALGGPEGAAAGCAVGMTLLFVERKFSAR